MQVPVNIRRKLCSLLLAGIWLNFSYGQFNGLQIPALSSPNHSHLNAPLLHQPLQIIEEVPQLAPSIRQALVTPNPAVNYHCPELAFFCRIEVELEKSAKLPVKFRLGDVQYVDWLEGKREEIDY